VNPLETYLRELREVRASGGGVEETSYYPALSNLLNDIGKALKPKVRCIINLQNRGAGIPDGGFFTADQIQRGEPVVGQVPRRGALEVKGVGESPWEAASGKQVARYAGRYRQVLVTNLREFLLVASDANGRIRNLESYALAGSAREFWAEAAQPRGTVTVHGARLVEFLKRVMLHAAEISTPEDVAWFLASYARDARFRIEGTELPALAAVRQALEEALGLRFEGAKGEHFFRSTLVQTLFYGVFSAWVLWHKEKPTRTDSFDWKQAAWSLHVPMIRALFEQVAAPTKLQPLGLVEPLDWASSVLSRVDRGAFFEIFDQRQAVQYFYEPFLQQFDPELRKELGVWYTPPEIVKYMVARVDTVLREELEIEDGLADRRVYVLDPCCGTGAYLVEVLHRIGETLNAKGGDALTAQDLKKAATSRVFGFEILPAPFVIAHLQLGLLLQQFRSPLSHLSSERVAVYLTNALTGWEPPKEPKQHLMFPELEEERDAAEEIKRDKPILVILGNPPYNAFAGVSPAEERGLVEPYKEGLNKPAKEGGWGIKKFNLDDLYVRFFRLAERRIVERKPGLGIVSFISNFSYLGDPSFVVMRQRFLREFDALWFDCMNGDSRETGKLTPDGKPDPSVFSTQYHQVGIQVGTAIGLMVRKSKRVKVPSIRYRDFWGVTKRSDLLSSLGTAKFNAHYKGVKPRKETRYSFRPTKVTSEYLSWPTVVDLAFRQPFAGLSEDRRKSLIGIDQEAIRARMKPYFDPSVDWGQLAALGTALTTDLPRFDAKKTRTRVLEAEKYDESRLLHYAMRPFDSQWCYYSPIRPLWREPRPEYWAAYEVGSPALVSRFKAAKSPEGPPLFFTRSLCDYHMMPPNASVIPAQLRAGTANPRMAGQANYLTPPSEPIANLSPEARGYLDSLGVTGLVQLEKSSLIWMHVLAIGYSAAYLTENADGVRQDWPRIPMPGSASTLHASGELGRRVASLLDTQTAVRGVTSGTIRLELREMGSIQRVGGGSLMLDAGELSVTAGWGHAGKKDVTMPGAGKLVRRDYVPTEIDAIRRGAEEFGLTLNDALQCLGDATCDVYLNGTAFWRNVPAGVWEYTIGGYQVIKKWLSYREQNVLGRPLTGEEAREVTSMVRRLAALVLMGPALDSNYSRAKAGAAPWISAR